MMQHIIEGGESLCTLINIYFLAQKKKKNNNYLFFSTKEKEKQDTR